MKAALPLHKVLLLSTNNREGNCGFNSIVNLNAKQLNYGKSQITPEEYQYRYDGNV